MKIKNQSPLATEIKSGKEVIKDRKGTISNGDRELILSSLRNQTEKLQSLIVQLEDKSGISYGPRWNYDELINIEYAIKMIRRIIKKYEN